MNAAERNAMASLIDIVARAYEDSAGRCCQSDIAATLADARALMDDAEGMPCTCEFCGRTARDSDAMAEGWAPYFYITDEAESNGSACPACAALHLEGEDIEPILKDGHRVFLQSEQVEA